jgi:hypothetical protein
LPKVDFIREKANPIPSKGQRNLIGWGDEAAKKRRGRQGKTLGQKRVFVLHSMGSLPSFAAALSIIDNEIFSQADTNFQGHYFGVASAEFGFGLSTARLML